MTNHKQPSDLEHRPMDTTHIMEIPIYCSDTLLRITVNCNHVIAPIPITCNQLNVSLFLPKTSAQHDFECAYLQIINIPILHYLNNTYIFKYGYG